MSGRDLTEDFEKLARECLDDILDGAFRLSGNWADAEDLAQETFARAFKRFHRFKKGTNFKAWLFRILMNLYIDIYRKRSKEPTILSIEELEGKGVEIGFENGEDCWEIPDKEVTKEDIEEALGSLPEDFRMAVWLRDVEDFSYSEISKIMGVPVGTVKSRIFRGREMLRKALERRIKG